MPRQLLVTLEVDHNSLQSEIHNFLKQCLTERGNSGFHENHKQQRRKHWLVGKTLLKLEAGYVWAKLMTPFYYSRLLISIKYCWLKDERRKLQLNVSKGSDILESIIKKESDLCCVCSWSTQDCKNVSNGIFLCQYLELSNRQLVWQYKERGLICILSSEWFIKAIKNQTEWRKKDLLKTCERSQQVVGLTNWCYHKFVLIRDLATRIICS